MQKKSGHWVKYVCWCFIKSSCTKSSEDEETEFVFQIKFTESIITPTLQKIYAEQF